MSLFMKMALRAMTDLNELEYFNLFLNIMAKIIDKIFPNLIEERSMKRSLDFLTFGYHLKLDMLDLSQKFFSYESVRMRLISVLSSKILTSDNTQHSLLYCFLKTLSLRVNSIMKVGSIALGDECMDLMRNLCQFYAYEIGV